MIKLFGKPIRVNKTAQDTQTQDVGANLFVGNLDPELDEKLLYDTFSAFGVIVGTPKVMRDPFQHALSIVCCKRISDLTDCAMFVRVIVNCVACIQS